jgi:ORF6N domain
MTPTQRIESQIVVIRGERVILAGDLAELYGVETRALNQAVKRNIERFPEDFAFGLTAAEFADLKQRQVVTSDGRAALRSQIVTLKRGQHAKYPPYAFTEHGAIMAAGGESSQQPAGCRDERLRRASFRLRPQATNRQRGHPQATRRNRQDAAATRRPIAGRLSKTPVPPATAARIEDNQTTNRFSPGGMTDCPNVTAAQFGITIKHGLVLTLRLGVAFKACECSSSFAMRSF